jgi:uncharacterized protein YfaS (alpha-2-macroglobulin family)
VTEEGLKKYITIKPSVKFDVQAEEDGFIVSGDGFDAGKTYEILLGKGLRGKLGGSLKEDYSGDIAFGELEPSISFVNSKAVYLSAQGNKNIEVRITSTEKVKIVISKIYGRERL